MKTSILYYCAFAVVVLSGVLFGLDWQSATMSPMPPIQVVALLPPAPKPAEPMAAPIPSAPPVAVAPKPAAPRTLAPSPVAQTPAKPLCDVTACAAAYHSFTASDCTYMPSAGVRRLCTKGTPPQ